MPPKNNNHNNQKKNKKNSQSSNGSNGAIGTKVLDTSVSSANEEESVCSTISNNSLTPQIVESTIPLHDTNDESFSTPPTNPAFGRSPQITPKVNFDAVYPSKVEEEDIDFYVPKETPETIIVDQPDTLSYTETYPNIVSPMIPKKEKTDVIIPSQVNTETTEDDHDHSLTWREVEIDDKLSTQTNTSSITPSVTFTPSAQPEDNQRDDFDRFEEFSFGLPHAPPRKWGNPMKKTTLGKLENSVLITQEIFSQMNGLLIAYLNISEDWYVVYPLVNPIVSHDSNSESSSIFDLIQYILVMIFTINFFLLMFSYIMFHGAYLIAKSIILPLQIAISLWLALIKFLLKANSSSRDEVVARAINGSVIKH